jgi:C-terminal processing protease CtpA/Prc
MLKYLFIVTLIAILNPLQVFGQNAIEVMLSEDQVKEDFQILKKSILKYHPDINLYTSKTEFDSLLNQVENSLDQTSILDFYRKMSVVVSNIRNRHTKLSLPTEIKQFLGKEAKRIPFKLFYRNDSLYVIQDASKEYMIREGSVITSINGVSDDELINTMVSVQSSDGFNKNLPIWTVTENFTTNYAISFGTPSSFNIEYIDQEKNNRQIEIEAIPRSEFSSKRYQSKGNNESKYEFKLVDEIGILTIRTFTIEDEKKFLRFLRDVFKQLNTLDISKLIIDVRGNLGGYPEFSDELLSYLIKEKIYPYRKQFALIKKLSEAEHFLRNDVFEYFHNERFSTVNDTLFVRNARKHTIKPKRNNYSGKLFFLIDEKCASTTSSMLGQAKTHLDAEFVGTETGGNPVTVVANYTVTQILPNSKIEFKLPLIKSEKNVSFSNTGRGLMPSIEVKPSVHDILNDKDVVLKKAIELINQ